MLLRALPLKHYSALTLADSYAWKHPIIDFVARITTEKAIILKEITKMTLNLTESRFIGVTSA
jgi:hypothetical protein